MTKSSSTPSQPVTDFCADLVDYIQQSPTPYHATQASVQRLRQAGFTELKESDDWQLSPGASYYCTRNQSSVIAFTYHTPDKSSFFKIIGAHTDSPCLKVLPNPIKRVENYFQLKVAAYGGVLLHPWFDRDLSLAGKITYLDAQQRLASCLIDLKRPIACVPSLAIHLNRGANENSSINVHEHMTVLLGAALPSGDSTAPDKKENLESFTDLLSCWLKAEHPDIDCSQILDHDLCFYDVQAPTQLGLSNELFAGARLDNLLSCHSATSAIIDCADKIRADKARNGASDNKGISLMVCNDHEEVGSQSDSGAAGPFLEQVIERLLPKSLVSQVIRQSVLFSVDNAHALHPNYSSKHENNHAPLLNHGPVIKYNANQRYATTADTAALAKLLASRLKPPVPLQHFAIRPDMGCGSTIGPISATRLGIRTVDIGAPTFAMHSVRELAGTQDIEHLYRLLSQFLSSSKEDCAEAAIV